MRRRAVRDRRDRGSTRAQVPRRQLAHLAGADEQHGVAREVAEHLLGEGGGGGRHRGRALADRGLDPGAAAGVQGLPKEPVEQRAGRSELERVPHLAEDLALARDERVETGRDAEQVQRGTVVAEPVENRGERRGVGAREREQRLAATFVERAPCSSLAR